MKALRSVFIIATITVTLCASAQNSEPEIMQRETFTDKIQKCRNLVYENTLDAHDTTAVRELLTYAQTTLETGSNIAFSLDEYRLLYLINGLYNDLLSNIKTTNDSTYYAENRGKRQHRFDNFFYSAMSYVYEHGDDIKNSISTNSTISEADKRFLILYINYITSSDRNEINDLCDEYLSTEPEKSYETFTRKYMRYKYEPYQKFGFYFGLLAGPRISTSSLGDIDNVCGNFGMQFFMTYQRFVFLAAFNLGISDTQIELVNHGVEMPKKTNYMSANYQLYLGYKIPLSSKWYLLPSGGMQSSDFTDNLPEKERIDFEADAVWKPGVAVELGHEWYVFSQNYKGKLNYYYYQLGIRYSITPTSFHMQSGTYSGVAHCIDITVGLGYSRAKRVY